MFTSETETPSYLPLRSVSVRGLGGGGSEGGGRVGGGSDGDSFLFATALSKLFSSS